MSAQELENERRLTTLENRADGFDTLHDDHKKSEEAHAKRLTALERTTYMVLGALTLVEILVRAGVFRV